jgi:hypothetical protein
VPTKAPPVVLGGAFCCKTTTKASVHSLRKSRGAHQGKINTKPRRIKVSFSTEAGIRGKADFPKTLNPPVTRPVETRVVAVDRV